MLHKGINAAVYVTEDDGTAMLAAEKVYFLQDYRCQNDGVLSI
jgi:hypothetical protein